jgi:hypothetical protein
MMRLMHTNRMDIVRLYLVKVANVDPADDARQARHCHKSACTFAVKLFESEAWLTDEESAWLERVKEAELATSEEAAALLEN